MLPDDHEVINNLDLNFPAEMRLFVLAAKRCFFEYQHALVADCPSHDCALFSLERLAPGFDLLLLDTRFERVFHNYDSLFGDRQLQFVRDSLVTGNSLIVATSGTRQTSKKEGLGGLFVHMFVLVPLLVINRFLCWVAQVVDNEFYPLSRPSFARSVEQLLSLVHNSSQRDVVFVGGDFHHFSVSALNSWRSVVASGMTRASTAAAAPHTALLFWATSLFPAAVKNKQTMRFFVSQFLCKTNKKVGMFRSQSPSDIFLGKNFVVVSLNSESRLNVEAFLDDSYMSTRERVVNGVVRYITMKHFIGTILAIVIVKLWFKMR
jgi:phosphodiesterase/alkaline phosphatase D-like protein